MCKVKPIGREKLKAAVEKDIERGSRSAEESWDKYDWVIKRAEHYAEKTGLDADTILNAWEENRDYWFQNYYQEANQPEIKGDRVRVFDTIKDYQKSVGKPAFRCPICNGVSTDPYECNSGLEMSEGKICNWKAYGLFGTAGKGVTVFIKKKVAMSEIFMPVAWEKEEENGRSDTTETTERS